MKTAQLLNMSMTFKTTWFLCALLIGGCSVPAGTPGPLTVSATLKYQTTSKEYVEFLDDQATTHGFPNDCTERTDGFLSVSRGAFICSNATVTAHRPWL